MASPTPTVLPWQRARRQTLPSHDCRMPIPILVRSIDPPHAHRPSLSLSLTQSCVYNTEAGGQIPEPRTHAQAHSRQATPAWSSRNHSERRQSLPRSSPNHATIRHYTVSFHVQCSVQSQSSLWNLKRALPLFDSLDKHSQVKIASTSTVYRIPVHYYYHNTMS